MKLRSVVPMKIAKYGYIIISAIFCAVGAAMILLPAPSSAAIGTFFGIAFFVFGVVKLVGYYSKDLFRLAFQYDLQFGILMILLGLITLLQPGNVIEFLCIALGICITLDCLFKGKIAFEAKHFGIRTWWVTLALAIPAGAAGLLLAFRPYQAMQVVTVLLGIALLTEGILNLGVAISLVKIITHQKPDVIDVDYYEVWEET